MITPRRIILCADDFALDDATSSAILDLAASTRISAVSCMTQSPLWPRLGPALLRQREQILTGLHFNLTHAFDGEHTSLPRILVAALARRLDPLRIKAALTEQIERFTDTAGTLPDFIDGHHHVHVLPTVAAVVRETAASLNPGSPIPLRAIGPFFGSTDAPWKRRLLRHLARLGEQASKNTRHIRLNTGFAGDYSLSTRADFAGLFESWLATAPDRALLMCHPGMTAECCFLKSAQFAKLLDAHRVRFLHRDEITRNAHLPGALIS